jgi:hypothetical protein
LEWVDEVGAHVDWEIQVGAIALLKSRAGAAVEQEQLTIYLT